MTIIKRTGTEVKYDNNKISKALEKANTSVEPEDRVSANEISLIVNDIDNYIKNSTYIHNVEDIQDIVEKKLFDYKKFKLCKNYITYRYHHQLNREEKSFLDKVSSIINHNNSEIEEENANKNPTIISTQRDYIAGEVSKWYAKDRIFPEDIIKAHKEGIIHIHDMDYLSMKLYNCCLINMDDMLQNGTVISGSFITKPKSFTTACNVATQIMAQVASSQLGGQTTNVYHLSKFVDVSRQKFIKQERERIEKYHLNVDDETFDKIIKELVDEEIKKGVQMIQYQINTLQTTNGQSPFASLFIYFNEAKEGQDREDLVLVTKEILKQRIKGIQNNVGAWVAPPFPKILYVLDTSNCDETTPYWEVTKLAAECTAKRMVPDYISEKVMKELKDGNVYGCMGCAAYDEVVTYKINGKLFVESIGRMWDRLALYNTILFQNELQIDQYMPLQNVEIFDSKLNKFVTCYQMNKNNSHDWYRVELNHRTIEVTGDHPFETENRGVVHAKDLTKDDKIMIHYGQYSDESEHFEDGAAWTLGTLICDGSYSGGAITLSIAATDEDDIEKRYCENMNKYFNIPTKTIFRDRGVKGVYKDIISLSTETQASYYFKEYLNKLFEGFNKAFRKIPINVFRWNRSAKVAFLAGMIDTDGYIHIDSGECFLGSTNKELALGQMKLVQALGIPAKVRVNHYKGGAHFSNVRYMVNFYPTEEIINALACVKKQKNFKPDNSMEKMYEISNVKSITKIHNISTRSGWSYDVTTESEHFEISGIYSHNCRSFLSVWKDPENDNKPKFWGRFNKQVCTVNLPDVALTIRDKYGEKCALNPEAMKEFWNLLDERLELCHKALLIRCHYLEGTTSDVAPILWQAGAIARLKPGEKIDKYLKDGYSTTSLGYVGLFETIMALTGKPHTADPETKKLALQIVQYMKETCDKWNSIPGENYGFSLYGTPEESTTYKFAKSLQKRHGIIEHITDKLYVMNSYHVDVKEDIDAFSKLKFESDFQKYTNGGAISYIETSNLQNNLDAVLSVIKYICDHIWYAELNCKLDYCQKCGYDGEIQIVEDENKKLIWECPNCGNRDLRYMNVVRRVCGYMSNANHTCNGRMHEFRDRHLHL